MKKIVLLALTSLIVLCSGNLYSMQQEGCGGECADCHKLSVKEANELLKDLGGKVNSVKFPEIKGLYELEVEKDGKKSVAYMDYGKRHIIPGPVFSLATRQPISGAAPQPPKLTRIDPKKVPLTNSLIMGNQNGKKKLIVFTDPECPFCGKLHAELQKLVQQDPDVKIYIKMFPLKIHPNAYDKARVILHYSSLLYLEDSFAGRKLPEPSPVILGAPVDETLALGEKLGIKATPTIIFPDGTVHAGSMEVAELKKKLGSKSGKKR